MNELKPCPFCRAKVMAEPSAQRSGIIFFLCDNCGAVISFRGIEGYGQSVAGDAWNRRITDEENGN